MVRKKLLEVLFLLIKRNFLVFADLYQSFCAWAKNCVVGQFNFGHKFISTAL